MDEIVFSARGLCKWFGEVIAINDLSFESRASIVGLLGPNGAGKSTLIKLLAGQLRPSKGEVTVLGQAPWANRPLLSLLGYCPEHDRFYEDLTPLEFVTVLTRLQGKDPPEAERLSALALARVGLDDSKLDQPIRSLSHGMRQKLKVAQALAHQPRWLILDEPLNGLDPVSRASMIALLREEASNGTRVLISSHVLHELEAMTSDILLLHGGRLVALGEVQAIRALIDGHPHRIEVGCDEPRALGRALLGFEHVMRVEIRGGTVILETNAPDEGYSAIQDLALQGGFHVRSLVSLDDNLEAVFRYLVQA